jgi:hypothetical protein
MRLGSRYRIAAAVVLAGLVVAGVVLTATRSSAHGRHTASGWVYVSPNDPVQGAEVRVQTLDGKDLTTIPAVSGARGTFVVKTKSLPARFLVVASGGSVGGQPSHAVLREVVEGFQDLRPLQLNPATTIAARYQLDHTDLHYADVTARVKQKLGLAPTSDLEESVHRSTREFDGRALLDAAAQSGSLDAYLGKLSADIDAHPLKIHRFVAIRSTQAKAPAPSESVVEGVLKDGGKAFVAGVAKAGLGYLIKSAGFGSVSDALGLTDPTPDLLAQLSTQLDAVQTQISAMSQTLDNVQSAVATIHSAVTTAEYANLVSAITNNNQLSSVTNLGTPSDQILVNLEFVAANAADAADAFTALPAGALSQWSSWCATNYPPSITAPEAGSPAAACSALTGSIGTGGPPAGTKDITQWCTDNKSSLADDAPLAAYSCLVLTGAGAYGTVGAGNSSDVLYADLVPPASDNNDGVFVAYDKKLFTDVTVTQANPLLTYENYSAPQDAIVSTWATRLTLLGGYAALVDSVESKLPTNCTTSTGTTTMSFADCDVARVADEVTNGIPAAIKPDIPDPNNGGADWVVRTIDTRTLLQWYPLSFDCGGTTDAALVTNLDHGNVRSQSCGDDPSLTATFPNVTSQALLGFLNGWQTWAPPGVTPAPKPSPNLWLTTAGDFPDFSYLDNNTPPAGYGPTGWAGTEFSVWAIGDGCKPSTFDTDDEDTSVGNGPAFPGYFIGGRFCTILRLDDAVEVPICLYTISGITPPIKDNLVGELVGCEHHVELLNNVPDYQAAPYNGHIDYNHGFMVFVNKPVSDQEYWFKG